jgi:hypothetical protein
MIPTVRVPNVSRPAPSDRQTSIAGIRSMPARSARDAGGWAGGRSPSDRRDVLAALHIRPPPAPPREQCSGMEPAAHVTVYRGHREEN